MRWDAVTIAAPFNFDVKTLEKELEYLQRLKFLDCDELIISNDACSNSGSGGSSLNALLFTAERLCARKGLSILTEDVIHNCKILIILIGPDSNFNVLTNEHDKFFETANAYILNTYFCNAYKNATHMASKTDQKGLWIIGTDSSWTFDTLENSDKLILSQKSITAFTFTGPTELAKSHGVYHTDGQKNNLGHEKISSLSYCNSSENYPDVNICLAFFYFPPSIATSFLEFHNIHPISASTYYGIDSGAVGLKLSLFFDFILPTCHSKLNKLSYSDSKREFVENRIGGEEKCENVKIDDLRSSRENIFDKFHKLESCIYPLSIRSYKYKELQKHSITPCHLNSEFHDELKKSLIQKLTTNSVQIHNKLDLCLYTMITFQKSYNLSSDYFQTLIFCVLNTGNVNQIPKILFTMSLALSIEANGQGGLRSGPAANAAFVGLLRSLQDSSEDPEVQKAIILEIVEEVNKNWRKDCNKMIRAARHLEAAAQLLISNSVSIMCQKKLLELKPNSKTAEPLLEKVIVTAPARVDLYGGWLDTPPIFFDFENAAVCNLAIQVDGKDPICCEIEITNYFGVHLVQGESILKFDTDEELMQTYNRPTKSGCLLCACIVALGFHSISKFLESISRNPNSGIRVVLTSTLPHGSGLGTSSIMAATIIKAIYQMIMGNSSPELSEPEFQERLVLTVLKVEQLMTTGGGWQDQIGAIYPGLKFGIAVRNGDQNTHSIKCKKITVSKSFESRINKQLILIYTGRTRLAKNILQEVIRNFYKDNEIRDVLNNMWSRTSEFERIIRSEKLPIELIDLYYNAKKKLAPECEPKIVKELIHELKNANLIETGWLAGAGGGGFCYVWTFERVTIVDVDKFLKNDCKFASMSCHGVTISNQSL